MDKKYLTIPALAQIKELVTLAKHYEGMLSTIRDSLVKVVQDETGINLSEGDWNLDTEKGVVVRVAAE